MVTSTDSPARAKGETGGRLAKPRHFFRRLGRRAGSPEVTSNVAS